MPSDSHKARDYMKLNEQGIAVLLVEDTQSLAAEVYDYLEDQGISVDYAAAGHEATKLAMKHNYDVIVLDVMLPDASGYDICQHMKQECSPVPAIIMLTARDSIEDKSQGFEAGADDYLTKPFSLRELLLRCKALARRQRLHQSQEVSIGDLVINQGQKTAYREQLPLRLSQIDFKILALLVDAYPNAVSRQQMLDAIWGDARPDSDVLRSHIYVLRRELDKPFSQPMLKTIHGIGFKLEVPGAQ